MKPILELLKDLVLDEKNYKRITHVLPLISSSQPYIMVCLIGYTRPMFGIFKSLYQEKISVVDSDFIKEKSEPQTEILIVEEKMDIEILRDYNFLFPKTRLIFFFPREPVNMGNVRVIFLKKVQPMIRINPCIPMPTIKDKKEVNFIIPRKTKLFFENFLSQTSCPLCSLCSESKNENINLKINFSDRSLEFNSQSVFEALFYILEKDNYLSITLSDMVFEIDDEVISSLRGREKVKVVDPFQVIYAQMELEVNKNNLDEILEV
jgi:hypothetical protein